MQRAGPSDASSGANHHTPAISARASLWLVLLALVAIALTAGPASAAVSSQSLGVDVEPTPTDLSIGSAAGLGVARVELIQSSSWSYADSVITMLANAHLRATPVIGLSTQYSTGTEAAPVLVSWLTSLVQRYGPNGTFWKTYPGPAEPIETYEIGNEPNIPLQWIDDSTNLHWKDPSDYATVYEAAEKVLHPLGLVAEVGGLADSDYHAPGNNVDLQSDETWLGAITAPIDAVGYHPYAWQNGPLSLMRTDLESLRQWMNGHGLADTPIAINEFGACGSAGAGCNNVTFTSSDWGTFAAGYTVWALCTPGLGVSSVDPFYWGDTSDTLNKPELPLVDGNGNLTPYGQDYLAAAHSLTTSGCPSPATSPTTTGTRCCATTTSTRHVLPTARLRIVRIKFHGSTVTLTVRVLHGTPSVKAFATKGHRRIRFHAVRRRHRGTLITLVATLAHGKWMITVSCVPPPGYAAPPPRHRRVRVAR